LENKRIFEKREVLFVFFFSKERIEIGKDLGVFFRLIGKTFIYIFRGKNNL
jgi:hypothetical protein